MTTNTSPDTLINAIADGLFDHQRITDKTPPMDRDGFREIIGSAVTQWAVAQSQSPGIAEHIDSLDGQLEYLIGRVKTHPKDEMASLIVDNIRERLAKTRTLAANGSCG